MKTYPLRIDESLYETIQLVAKKNARSMNAEITEALSKSIPEVANSMVALWATTKIAPEGETARQTAIRYVAESIDAVSEELMSLNEWMNVHQRQLLSLSRLQQKLMSFDEKNKMLKFQNTVSVPSEEMLSLSREPENQLQYKETFVVWKGEQAARQRAKNLMLLRFKTTTNLARLAQQLNAVSNESAS